jgi:hypothetical protein
MKYKTFIWQCPAASSTAQIGLNNSSKKFSTSHNPNGYSTISLSTTKEMAISTIRRQKR